jgi:hypothetical protein
MKNLSIFLLSVLLFQCAPKETYLSEGEEITSKGYVTTDEFLNLVSQEKEDFKVKGVVEEVCQMKGCWMTLKNEQNISIRVTFKDYGFFVPKDISGREVILEGVGFKELLDEETAKHYAEDGKLEYNESMRNQISFVAKGVLIQEVQS